MIPGDRVTKGGLFRSLNPHLVLKTPKAKNPDNLGFIEDDRNQIDLERIIAEIFREIQEERMAGVVKPFVEGEPIGACPPPRPVVVFTREQLVAAHNARMERKREALTTLRERNDRTIEELLAWPLRTKPR